MLASGPYLEDVLYLYLRMYWWLASICLFLVGVSLYNLVRFIRNRRDRPAPRGFELIHGNEKERD